jgi:hypothetical protein
VVWLHEHAAGKVTLRFLFRRYMIYDTQTNGHRWQRHLHPGGILSNNYLVISRFVLRFVAVALGQPGFPNSSQRRSPI